MKKFLQVISWTETWQILQPLTTTYMIYLGVYYSVCSQQVRTEEHRLSFHVTGISFCITTENLEKRKESLEEHR